MMDSIRGCCIISAPLLIIVGAVDVAYTIYDADAVPSVSSDEPTDPVEEALPEPPAIKGRNFITRADEWKDFYVVQKRAGFSYTLLSDLGVITEDAASIIFYRHASGSQMVRTYDLDGKLTVSVGETFSVIEN